MPGRLNKNSGLPADLPILITSSVTPHDAGVKLADPEKRLYHAIEAIEQWIRISPESPLVLCDGSNFDFQPVVKDRFPHATIECLLFGNDQDKIKLYGRGYGEGEIVKFALAHSALLRGAEAFVKCSSKLWVDNYPDCLQEWRGECLFSGVFKNAFSVTKKTEMVQVDTRFYIADKNFYAKNLMDAHHQIGAFLGFGLEDCFYDALIRMHKTNYLFTTPPIICGVGGGIGKYYKTTRVRKYKEKIRLWLISRSAEFRKLFVL